MKRQSEDPNQLRFFADNGYIMPCPYTNRCTTYKVGCAGLCYWCGHFDKEAK